jgi:hypothetical protein
MAAHGAALHVTKSDSWWRNRTVAGFASVRVPHLIGNNVEKSRLPSVLKWKVNCTWMVNVFINWENNRQALWRRRQLGFY